MVAPYNSFLSPQTIKASTCELTTANVNYDAPAVGAALVLLFTAGARGARILRVSAIPRETVADTQLQLFRDGNGAGVSMRFFKSAKMASYAMATGTEAPTTDFGYSDDNPLILAAGEKIYAATALSKKITVNAEGADY